MQAPLGLASPSPRGATQAHPPFSQSASEAQRDESDSRGCTALTAWPALLWLHPVSLMGKTQCLLMGGRIVLQEPSHGERCSPQNAASVWSWRCPGKGEGWNPGPPARVSEFRNGAGEVMAPQGWCWLLFIIIKSSEFS